MPEVCVLTSDKHAWALRPFAHQFQKYWPSTMSYESIKIFGFSPPPYPLPDTDFEFISLGRMADYPANFWTKGLEAALEKIQHDIVLLLLEDYWMVRRINRDAIRLLEEYMYSHEDVLSINVTSDKIYQKEAEEHGYYEDFDLIKSLPSAPYHLNIQAALWNRHHLLAILKGLPEPMSPWRFETMGTHVDQTYPNLLLLGTRQPAMRYVIGIRNGKPNLDGSWQFPKTQFTPEDKEALQGMLP